MTTGRNHDPRIDPACLDAETLAAWLDDGLDASAAALAEAHVSSCARCQELVAVMAATEPPSAPAPAPWWQRYRAGWLVPLTAGVAAVALWMIVPANQQPASSPQLESREARVEAPVVPVAPPASPVVEAEPARSVPPTTMRADEPKKEANAPVVAAKRAANEASAADRAQMVDARTNEATAAEPQALGRLTAQAPAGEFMSADASVRWRIRGGGRVERSSDARATWDGSDTGVAGGLTAGSAPSAGVCWMVGRGGVVVRTTDGTRWQRLSFPETLDLLAIQATDARTASVTAADGRVFRTTDAGATWATR